MIVDLRMTAQRDRDEIYEKAKGLVLDAYREGCRNRSQAPFDAALNSYMSRYPHISRELAGHAVAHILATAGV
jgi:hypothetical protein